MVKKLINMHTQEQIATWNITIHPTDESEFRTQLIIYYNILL